MKHKLLFALAVLCSLGLFAQPAGWNQALPLTVMENSGTMLTDYQVRLTLNTQTPISAGQMQATGADIRFGKDCAGNTMYSYWVESGINTASTVIWVKVDTLFASTPRTIYMFYGNAIASTVSAINGTFMGPMSSTDSVSGANTGGVTNSQRGFRFAPTEDILVTAFGKNEPTGSTRYVTIFNFSTQAILAQNQVSGPAAQYSYGNLPNPLWLTQGTQYLCEIYQGASDGYYFGAAPQAGQHLTYLDMRYCNGCTQNTFPTSSLGGMHYGYVDFWYFIRKHASAEPSATAAISASVSLGSDLMMCAGDSVQLPGTVNNGVGPFTYSWGPASGLDNPLSLSPMASPANTTQYILYVSDGGMCASSPVSDTINVTVNQLPPVGATTLNSLICAGDTADLVVTGAISYVWMPGGETTAMISVTPATTSTYSVIGTDANGCVDTALVSVTVNPLPVVSATGNYATACDNAAPPLTLSATGTDIYLWQPINQAGDSVVTTPSASTTYIVTGTDANGCSDTASYSVTLISSPSLSVFGSGDTICPGTCAMMNANALDGTSPYAFTWLPALTTGPIYTDCPTATTCYTVIVVDANGCSDTVVTCNYVFATPNIVATGPAAMCAGDSVALIATGSNIATIDWFPASSLNPSTGNTVVANPSATTTYTVIGTSADGCQDTTFQALTVNPLPNVTYTSSVNTVCTTDPAFTLTGGSPAGGSYSGPGVSGSTFSPATAGVGSQVITYTVTDANSCTNFATHTIVVNPCTGVNELANGGISVLPNPFTTMIAVQRANADAAVVNIYDAQGRLVLAQTITGTKAEISTDGLAVGVYTLQVVDEKDVQSFRVVKN